MTATTDTDDLIVETPLLRDALRLTARKWYRLGIGIVVVGSVLVLLVVPQSYTSTASVAIQQSNGDTSSLAILTGAKQTPRYIGILKSRTAAFTVLDQVPLSPMYHFTSNRKEIEFLQKRLVAEDDIPTGLLNISVSLPGPPKLSPDTARRARVQQLTAQLVNAYVRVLKSYYVNNDNDRESVILRTADAETAQARSGYELALHRLTTFAASLKHVDPRSIPNPGKADVPPAVDELGELYSALGKVETQQIALEASQGTVTSLISNQLGSLGNIPTEDPLLSAARARVSQDQAELQALQVTYGPDHPNVILAKNRLKVDEATLQAQTAGVRRRTTTEQVVSQANLANITAQRQSLENQITDATQRLSRSRDLSASLARLRSEVEIRLEVLRATLTEAARIRMQYASVQSRVSVIDSAIPPDEGQPRAALLIGAVVALVAFIYLAASLNLCLKLQRDSAARTSISSDLKSSPPV